MADYETVIMAALGLAVLFFGYRIKKIAFFIVWFLLGFNLIMFFMPNINQMVPEIANNELYQNLLPIGGGLLLALLGFSIEKICVGGIAFAITMMITVTYFGTEILTLAVGGIVGVAVASLAVMLMKPAVIVATSAVGSYVITLAILNLVPQLDSDVFYWPLLIGIALVGAIFQFMTTKKVS